MTGEDVTATVSRDRRSRTIQRLSLRGPLTVKMEMRQVVSRKWTDENLTTHTEFASVDQPWWVIHIKRRNPRFTGWTGIILNDFCGWDDVHVEDVDLDAALAEAEQRSRPRHVWLDDHVYEHLAWRRDFVRLTFALTGGYNPVGPFDG